MQAAVPISFPFHCSPSTSAACSIKAQNLSIILLYTVMQYTLVCMFETLNQCLKVPADIDILNTVYSCRMQEIWTAKTIEDLSFCWHCTILDSVRY